MKLKAALLTAFLTLTATVLPAMQAPAAAPAPAGKAAKKTADATPPPSDSDITAAKAKGLVWVNTSSKVFHQADNEFYGKTKHGKFMTADDATKAGYKAAKEPAAKKTKTDKAAAAKK